MAAGGEQKVALFVPDLEGGGAESMMANLAGALAASGVKVDLVLGRAAGPYLEQIPSSVRVVNLNAPRILLSLMPLVRYLRAERPSALLSTLDHANVIALCAKGMSRVPLRLVVRIACVWTEPAQVEGIRFRVILFLLRSLIRYSDHIVAISNGVAADLRRTTRHVADKIQVIHNPAFTAHLLEMAERDCRHPWLQNTGTPVILAVGRLDPQKDFATLLRAFAQLRRHRAARLVILGEGNERNRLEQLARDLGVEEDVALPGFADNPFAYMKRAQLLVLSSRYEGFGNVLVEAMSLGTPVVSTDCPSGPAEILEGGRWGRLVPVGDPQALATAMEITLDDPPRDAIARGRQFSLDAVMGAYRNALGLQASVPDPKRPLPDAVGP